MKHPISIGFTLIELLVVIAIIGLIILSGVLGFQHAQKLGRDSKRMADLRVIQQALVRFYNAKHYYPGTKTGTATYLKKSIDQSVDWIGETQEPLVPTFLPALPRDPVNTTNSLYVYIAHPSFKQRYYLATPLEAKMVESDSDGGACGQGTGWYEIFSDGAAGYGSTYGDESMQSCRF